MGSINKPVAGKLSARLRLAYLMVIILLSGGTLGYRFIENWSWVDSFFMTVITISTVGYGTVGGELTEWGKLFSSV